MYKIVYNRQKYYWCPHNTIDFDFESKLQFSNIAIAILDFSLLLLVKLSLLILFAWDSNSCFSIRLLKVIAKSYRNLFAIAFKSKKE